MKEIALQPMIADENVLVQFTQDVTVDKKTAVKVPNGFRAIVFINEKIAFRIEAGAEKKICAYAKDYVNQNCKIAFVRTKPLPQMIWGFGNIGVNFEDQICRIGANGKYRVEIIEATKLLNTFDNANNITLDAVREKSMSMIKNKGSVVFGEYFKETSFSVDEVAAQTDKVREKLLTALNETTVFSEIGLALKDMTVEKIHINEEDLELIRNRNEIVSQEERGGGSANSDFKEEFSSLKSELTEMVASEIRHSEQRMREENIASVKAELERHREVFSQSFYEQIKSQLSEFGESISSEIEDMICERLPLNEGAKADNVQKKGGITARELLDRADNADDMATLAGKIYTKVEENLIGKYKLPYKNKKFYMSYADYLQAVNEAHVGERFFLKQKDKNGILRPLPPIIIDCYENGAPLTVEMHPVIRFMRAGLTPQEAKRATEMWYIMNKIRHKSDENKKKLEEFFKHNKPIKEYMKDVLDFYQEKWLYTED